MCHCIIPDFNVVTGPYFIIGRGIVAPGHGREVVDGLNAIEKSFLFHLISTLQLPGTKGYDTKMVMHNVSLTSDVILDREKK